MAIPRWKHDAEEQEQEQQEPEPVRRRIPRWKRGIPGRTRPPADVPPGTVVSRVGDKPPTREYTPGQLYAISKFQQARSLYQWGQQRRRIDPTKTYLIPNVQLMEGGKGYRKLSGEEVLSDIDRSYRSSWKGQVGLRQEIKQYHPGTRIKRTDKGYTAIFPYAGAENYEYYKEKLDRDLLSQIAVKLTTDDLFGISSFIDEQTGKRQKATDTRIKALHKIMTEPVITAVQSPVAHLPWYFVGGAGIKVGLGYAAGKLAFRPVASAILTKLIPATVGGVMLTKEGLDIKTTFERGDTGAGAVRLTTLGLSLAALGLGYRAGGKLTFKGLTPKQIGYTKALPESKMDFSKLPVLKQMKSFKGYNLDLRIARGMKFGIEGKPSYGKLPAYLGRRSYGASEYISTLQQMKGTLKQSGYRGGDPLKAASWKEYYFHLTQPKLSPKMLSAMKYNVDLSGVSVSPVYNVKWGLPKLATGEMPYQTSQIPIKISGYKKGITRFKFPEYKPEITKFISKTKTSQSLVSLPKQSTGTTTQLRFAVSDMVVSKRYLNFLDSLKLPYESYTYPSGSRIGLQIISPAGKLISPVAGFSTGIVKGGLGAYVFDSIRKGRLSERTTIRTSDFLKGDNILNEFRQMSSGATLSSTATLSLTKSATATATTLRQIIKQLTKGRTAYKSSYPQITQPRTVTHDFSDYVPRVVIPKIPLFPLPKELYGRGKKGWPEEGVFPFYRFREHKIGTLSKDIDKMLKSFGLSTRTTKRKRSTKKSKSKTRRKKQR